MTTDVATNHRANVKSVSISAVKIGVDGKRTDLGVISYWHKNPFMRLLHALRRTFLGVVK